MEICRCICYRFVRRPEYKYGNGVWSVLFLIKYVGLNHDESIATHSWNRLKSQSWFQSWYFSNLICTLVIQNQIKYTPLSFYLYLRQPDLFATQNLCNVSIYIYCCKVDIESETMPYTLACFIKRIHLTAM